MTNPFRDAMREISGVSRLDQVARASLRAAEAKFAETRHPSLRVDLGGTKQIGAHDTALVSMALQSATAKLGHLLRDPSQEWTQSRRNDREEAILIPRAQAGRTILFGFPSPDDHAEGSLFPDHDVPSLSERAVLELCEILPRSADDDAALDAVLGQRTTIRSAVMDIAEAVSETATSLGLELTVVGRDHVHSEVSTDQAAALRDSLRETRTDRRQQQMVGRLDGVRTRRRIFYLELETGEEIHGAVGPDAVLMEQIRQHLDQSVIAFVESERVESMSGRRGRPTYRLLSLERNRGIFD